MNKNEARLLQVKCDKNIAWKQIEIAVELWAECIDMALVTDEQLRTFKKILLGALMVEHNNGAPIKLFKEVYNGDRKVEYTLFRKALDFSGISIRSVSNRIRRMTIYPSGALKVEYADKRVEWL